MARLASARLPRSTGRVGIGEEVDHRQLLEADRVVRDDRGDRDRGQLGAGLHELLVLLLGHFDRFALGRQCRSGVGPGLRLGLVLA